MNNNRFYAWQLIPATGKPEKRDVPWTEAHVYPGDAFLNYRGGRSPVLKRIVCLGEKPKGFLEPGEGFEIFAEDRPTIAVRYHEELWRADGTIVFNKAQLRLAMLYVRRFPDAVRRLDDVQQLIEMRRKTLFGLPEALSVTEYASSWTELDKVLFPDMGEEGVPSESHTTDNVMELLRDRGDDAYAFYENVIDFDELAKANKTCINDLWCFWNQFEEDCEGVRPAVRRDPLLVL